MRSRETRASAFTCMVTDVEMGAPVREQPWTLVTVSDSMNRYLFRYTSR
jgi:hypothetical protein